MGSNEDNPFIELIKKIFEIKVEGIVLPAFLVLISPSLALLIIGALVFSGAIALLNIIKKILDSI
jgi:hypothetical protein